MYQYAARSTCASNLLDIGNKTKINLTVTFSVVLPNSVNSGRKVKERGSKKGGGGGEQSILKNVNG